MVNIKVAVRIRPLSHRELLQGEEVVVRKESKSVVVTNPKIPERQDGDSRQRSRRFPVDYCFDPQEPENCTQEAVYKEIGSEVLDSILEGYNACVLAYGHSASGKTYTIMGLQEEPGLTPRICEGLFQRAGQKSCHEGIRVEVAVSFLEIYNEKVKDLLGSEEAGAVSGKLALRVREHPKLGPYVQGLSEHSVADGRALLDLLTTGNRKRSTAATENNRQSSRSHAVFTLHLRQSDGEKCDTEKWSKVHLVDLAGSERASAAQSKARLQEGANINKSLVTLGHVISALAESLETREVAVQKEQQHHGSKCWQPFVPYRDSVLTWLLKDTLGGNSNTIMIATISPASGCLSETVNTLRYAKRTKRIVNEAIVNEDPKVRTIRELRKEIARLKGLLVCFQSVTEEGCGEEEGGGGGGGGWERWVGEGMSGSDGKGGGGGKGRVEGRVRSHNSAASPVEVNDEKESVVNGSTNDTFSHESENFSDSLESLGSVFVKSGNSCEASNEGSGEAGRGGEVKRMHRSRPDLIKGISGRLTERFPSTSSQSWAEVSNLSQSTSENSVASSEGRGGRGKERRSEVVEAVTTRLYVTKKKPEEWGRVLGKKESGGEGEELKLCKRARMKLFDLSRKLAMTRKIKRTADSDTQTEAITGTIRVKEKSVETEVGGDSDDGGGKVPEAGWRGSEHWAVESGTQTVREEKSDKSANTSPMGASPLPEEESFSEDSLDLDGAGGKESEMEKWWSCLRGEGKTGEAGESLAKCLSVYQKNLGQGGVHPSTCKLGSKKEEILSSDSSLTSAEGTELISSSEASSEDFVFCENPKEDSGVEAAAAAATTTTTTTRDRELYTITENSEGSDPSDAVSPVQSQSEFPGVVEAEGGGRRWKQKAGQRSGGSRREKGTEERNVEWRGGGGGEQTGKAKKTKWGEWQSNCEKQYLNLNVSRGSRGPFSVDTNLFGQEWKKEQSQSSDAMFTSADSITLVFMGPAKPKSSVLMEIIKRGLRRNGSSDEGRGSSERKSESKGVQCEENLVRSVSVDMAMIALSRIARNQQRSPNIARTASLGALDACGADAPSGDGGTGFQCDVDPDYLDAQKKKSALKCSMGNEDAERPKKSVSWSGETTYDVQLEGDRCATDANTRTSSGDDLTAFLKEAIHLLKKINSASEEANKEAEAEGVEGGAREKRKNGVEMFGGGGGGGKGDSWLEREEGREGRGRGQNSTWPRRRGTTGKPPTGMRGRFGRSGVGVRSESVQSEWGRGCRGNAGRVRNWWNVEEEVERRWGRWGVSYEEEGRREMEVRVGMGKVESEIVLGAEREVEKCCRRLGLAVERDELREKLLERRRLMEVEVEVEVEGEGERERERKEVRKAMKRRKDGRCTWECSCRSSVVDPCKHLLRQGCQSSFELDSFGPGSKHCHQLCMFCRKKDAELYSSVLNLNSECVSGACRLDYYGYCPCSSGRLIHVASSPRAYMQHLLTLRREIVGRSKALLPPRANPFPCFSPT